MTQAALHRQPDYLVPLEIVVFTVHEHENICIAGLNHWAGYGTN